MTQSSPGPSELKIFKGAQAALAQYGMSKLTMSDVCRAAGVSRATVYRYFSSREELLRALSLWEEACFVRDLSDSLSSANPEQRFKVLLQRTAAIAQDYPSLLPLLENDPGYVLANLRVLFPTVLEHSRNIMLPIMTETWNTSDSDLTVDQLIECFVRLALTTYLFPDPDPQRTHKTLAALYELTSAYYAKR